MGFRSGEGTIPYQPSHSIQPKYGFRYSNSTFAPAISPIDVPPLVYTNTKPAPPAAVPNKSSPVMGTDGEHDNDSAAASTQLSLDQANQNINDIRVPDQIKGPMMYSPEFNPMSLVPGIGTMSGLMGDSIPKSGFGADGTYSGITGGRFDGGRSYDPITGVANQEYATMGAFKDNFMDDPLANTFGDKANTFTGFSDPSHGTGAYQQAIQNSYKEGSANYGMGTLSNQDKIMRKVGMDSGIPEHSLVKTRTEKDGSKTILGTTKQGAQIKGQDLHLPKFGQVEGVEYGKDEAHGMAAKQGGLQAGVYNESGDQDDGSSSGTTSATATAGQGKGTGTSYADDAQSSSSGGGGK